MSPSPASPTPSSLGVRLVKRLIFLLAGILGGAFLWSYSTTMLQTSPSPPPPSPSSTALMHLPPPQQSPLSLYGQKTFLGPPAGAKQILCILFRVGEDPELTQKALETLPREVAIALSPHTQDVRYWAQQFHQRGHEILLSIGLEPEGFPLNDPGAHTLLTGLSPQEMAERVTWALEHVPYAIGVTHETGSQFTVLDKPLRTLFKILHARQLLFLDTMASPESRSSEAASLEEIPLLTVDHPFSSRTLPPEKIPELRAQAARDERIVVSLSLSPSALPVITHLPCPVKPIPGKKNTSDPAVVFVPLSFALQNPVR